LPLCSSYLPLGVPNWTVIYINTMPHEANLLVPLPGTEEEEASTSTIFSHVNYAPAYIDIVIRTRSLPFLETWPPIYRSQERTVRDRLKASQVYTYVYFRYTPCLINFTFEFIRRPIPSILSPSYWRFVELTLVTKRPTKAEREQRSDSRMRKMTSSTSCLPELTSNSSRLTNLEE
jgi:hypothetical protein